MIDPNFQTPSLTDKETASEFLFLSFLWLSIAYPLFVKDSPDAYVQNAFTGWKAPGRAKPERSGG
jgi:hypothetical protein